MFLDASQALDPTPEDRTSAMIKLYVLSDKTQFAREQFLVGEPPSQTDKLVDTKHGPPSRVGAFPDRCDVNRVRCSSAGRCCACSG